MPIVNCSKKGMAIAGIPYVSLEQCAAQWPEVAIERHNRKPVHFFRAFQHKDIVQNFEGWTTMISDCLSECKALLALETIDQPRFEALIYVYNFRICIDPLFVAFIVQCCAKEFFELENKWWALDSAFNMDQHKKIEVIQMKLELFQSVLQQLIAIFKECQDGATKQVYKSSDA